jgi:IS5 family transposase
MIGKTANQNQRDLFEPLLKDFIDMSHELVLLSNKIDSKNDNSCLKCQVKKSNISPTF